MDGNVRLTKLCAYPKFTRSSSWKVPVFSKARIASNSNTSVESMEELSGVVVIIMMAGVALTSIMTFVFVKRQIMRFTLRNRRGPHIPVGADAKRVLRREIERRIDYIQKISKEPKLLWEDNDKSVLSPYYFRMRAVDDVKKLEQEIARADASARRCAYDSLRAFLLTTLNLTGSDQRIIHQFCDMYEHARHDPNDFGSEEYTAYERLLTKLMEAAKQLKQLNSRKGSPARAPHKQTKMHSLLDPARLRPPAIDSNVQFPASSDLTAGQNSKVNLTLGLQGKGLSLAANPLHLQAPAERDLFIRSSIKTPTLDDIIPAPTYECKSQCETEDNEIRSISSVNFQRGTSNV